MLEIVFDECSAAGLKMAQHYGEGSAPTGDIGVSIKPALPDDPPLSEQQMQEGLTLVPLSVYLSDGRVKLELGVCKGKKNYDKRDALQQRDTQREMQRAMRSARRDDY